MSGDSRFVQRHPRVLKLEPLEVNDRSAANSENIVVVEDHDLTNALARDIASLTLLVPFPDTTPNGDPMPYAIVDGVPISDAKSLRQAGIDRPVHLLQRNSNGVGRGRPEQRAAGAPTLDELEWSEPGIPMPS